LTRTSGSVGALGSNPQGDPAPKRRSGWHRLVASHSREAIAVTGEPYRHCHQGSSSRVAKPRDTASPDRIGNWTAAWPALSFRLVGRYRVTGVFFEKRRRTPWR